jgi:redox-sensitive bicupin YhaK (pirin superfamily)
MVGPFIFLDHMGPACFEAGDGMDVRPRPHIGLATVTYLLDDSIVHRDTLRSDQEIVPGDVDASMQASATSPLPEDHAERSAYVIEGERESKAFPH